MGSSARVAVRRGAFGAQTFQVNYSHMLFPPLIKVQRARKPSQQSIGKLATLGFFMLGLAARLAMFTLELKETPLER